MKIIDNKGRIFGKINIVDFVAFVILIILLFLATKEIFNVISKNNIDLGTEKSEVNIEFEVAMLYEKDFFDVIKIGDKLIERNNELSANIIDIKISAVSVKPVTDTDSDNLIEIPFYEKANVKINATVKNKNYTYKLGQQTIAIGKFFTLESKLYKYNSQIVNVVEIDK